jgi:hypothetical protein
MSSTSLPNIFQEKPLSGVHRNPVSQIDYDQTQNAPAVANFLTVVSVTTKCHMSTGTVKLCVSIKKAK